MKTGIEIISAERDRQILETEYNAEHDDTHTGGELIDAAYAYGLAAMANYFSPNEVSLRDIREGKVPQVWPWRPEQWKHSTDPIANLAKAGALIAAEIDRLNRR